MIPPVAILCGGLATRMRPITETIPKSLIEVNGEPFLFRQLRLLKAKGLERVVLCAGHMGEMIRDAVGDGRAFGLRADYSFDGKPRLGTGGALKKALPLLGDVFLVLYGDSYLECDYLRAASAFEASGADALMTVFRNENRFDASNIVFADGKILAYDKKNRTPEMRHIDYGLGVVRAGALDGVPTDSATDLADVYQRLLSEGKLAGLEVPERFYEIGSPAGLAELEKRLGGDGHA